MPASEPLHTANDDFQMLQNHQQMLGTSPVDVSKNNFILQKNNKILPVSSRSSKQFQFQPGDALPPSSFSPFYLFPHMI